MWILCAVTEGTYTLFAGYAHLAAGLSCGLAGLAAGMAIGIVGDSGVRSVSDPIHSFLEHMVCLAPLSGMCSNA